VIPGRVEPFEKHAIKYEDRFTEHRFAYESELEAVRQQLPQSRNGIEIGVGSERSQSILKDLAGIDTAAHLVTNPV
jgi:hypothetical protein